ncbi:hypothetical protein VCHC52A1_2948 [Vibrio cholerae HC-52A1]|nr:hypothetical protein VCHC52A1_2948 [Vibrio cholerae HC-52A1]EKG67027.1 hypothetical protein VCHC57A1_2857 [Vibrio cholerae HC-57A1]
MCSTSAAAVKLPKRATASNISKEDLENITHLPINFFA